MEFSIIQKILIIHPLRYFLLIPSLRFRYNSQWYYILFYKDKLCKNKEAEFDKKSKSQFKNVLRVESSNTENYNNNDLYFF